MVLFFLGYEMKFCKLKYQHWLFYVLWSLLIINLGQTIFSLLYSDHILFDNFEHLKAVYFVSSGDIPYRDFFEHHHPLLWYLLAPFINFFPREPISAIYLGRFICLLISVLSGYYIYKTEKKFIGGTLCALFCLNLYFCAISNISLSGLFQIKPDIFQRCCFFAGLYYLFCYFRYRKFYDLQICALLWTLAFLFLQTTIFYVVPFVFPVGYFIYKNPSRMIDFIKASAIPMIIIISCIVLLWKEGLLMRYYETNWQLNSVIASVVLYIRKNYAITLYLADILFIAIVAIAALFYKKKINIYIISVLSAFIVEFLFRTFYVTHGYYYLTWLLIYAAMLAAPLATKICLKIKIMLVPFIAIIFIHLFGNLIIIGRQKLHESIPIITQTGCEIICSDIFCSRHSYYWMYPSIEMFDDILFNPAPEYDLTSIYKQKNSKILFSPPTSDNKYYTKGLRGIREKFNLTEKQEAILQHHLIDDFVRENYIEIGELTYQRKDTLSDIK